MKKSIDSKTKTSAESCVLVLVSQFYLYLSGGNLSHLVASRAPRYRNSFWSAMRSRNWLCIENRQRFCCTIESRYVSAERRGNLFRERRGRKLIDSRLRWAALAKLADLFRARSVYLIIYDGLRTWEITERIYFLLINVEKVFPLSDDCNAGRQKVSRAVSVDDTPKACWPERIPQRGERNFEPVWAAICVYSIARRNEPLIKWRCEEGSALADRNCHAGGKISSTLARVWVAAAKQVKPKVERELYERKIVVKLILHNILVCKASESARSRTLSSFRSLSWLWRLTHFTVLDDFSVFW